MNTPILSVLMAVYNGMPYLPEAIMSVLRQTFVDFEFVIVNDCSTDQTPEVLEEFSKIDPRIKIIHNQSNKRQTASLNIGLAQCKGKYIGRIDADDMCHPERFENQIRFLERNLEIGMVGSDWTIIDTAGVVIGAGTRPNTDESLRWLQFNTCPVGASGVCRTDIIRDQLKGYNESFTLPQDWELCSRMLKVTKFHSLSNPYYILRRHENQSTTQNQSEATRQANLVVRQSAVNLFPGIDEGRIERIVKRKEINGRDSYLRMKLLSKLFKQYYPNANKNPEYKKLVKEDERVLFSRLKGEFGILQAMYCKSWSHV